ncbi:Spy/CpxP family protein refolding chaperone [Halothermothrix orenii]|uniref:P pilus assembly/Cpx signaling pathway, periplasmic inhibitor/zinc-resistance associated protein n=1 Tax=Halothermothrix orenii (strain H 168 / OCM 544 / DSM 9562) TaxID=373903 RepID=B8CXR1_HALOH|nr:Spy/CpxP family protein refolding chaperone [Halothermothrix orenii]ACL70080.1 P pilus assembly/Cpx signaling pathway, periplasmic inhibitor/zinc-resistance associated protein [Halothermothrix orenii H 168]
MNKKFVIAGLLILSLAITGASINTLAFGGGPYNNNSTPYSNYDMFEYLGLTSSQVEALSNLKRDFSLERDKIRLEMRKAVYELRDLIFSNIESKEINLAKERLNELQNKLLDLRIRYLQEYKNILTPEQLEKIKVFPFKNGFNWNNRWAGKGWNRRNRQNFGPVCPFLFN